MAGRAVVAPHRIPIDKRMADAVYLLGHEGTRAMRSDRDGLVLSCADPDGFEEAVGAWRGPGWARQALQTVAWKVRNFRQNFPFEEIR